MNKPLRLITALVTKAAPQAAFGVALGLAVAAGSASAQDAKAGNAAAGEKKVAMCIGCHNIPGYQASFPEIYKVPKIAGQSGAYIVSALAAYRKGERRHPSMRAIATSLSDQDMADVAAYYEQLGKGDGAPVPAKPEQAAPADAAKLLAQANCASCHGANFSSPIAGYPKLAGQHADYLYVALKAYQTDHNNLIGRNNQIMMGMARPFTHAELKVLASYLSSLPGELKTVSQSRFR